MEKSTTPGVNTDKTQDQNGTIVMVHNAIRDMIMNNELLPGKKINQLSIAKKLNISRTPVVNALHRLESEGLVDRMQNSGFTVHRLSIQEFQDLFDLREALDIIVAKDLVEKMSDSELQSLEELFTPYIESPEKLDAVIYRSLDLQFHTMLVTYSRNKIVEKVYDNMQVLARTYIAGLIRHYSQTFQEHLEIIEALKTRDPQKAEITIRSHNQKTTNLIHETVNGLMRMGLNPDTILVDEVKLGQLNQKE